MIGSCSYYIRTLSSVVGCRWVTIGHSTVNTAEPAKVGLLTLSPLSSSCFFPPFFLQFGDIWKNSLLKPHVLCMYLFTSSRVGCLFVVIGSPIGDFTVWTLILPPTTTMIVRPYLSIIHFGTDSFLLSLPFSIDAWCLPPNSKCAKVGLRHFLHCDQDFFLVYCTL